MNYLFVLSFVVTVTLVNGAVIIDDGDVDEQGLYRKSDNLMILTNRNFEHKIYGRKQALVLQFYNSYCGHCRAFAPKFITFASEILPWKNIIQLAVIDCSVEENNQICRQFEVMAYPSLRYLHENYEKGNGNVGEKLNAINTIERLKSQIINKMQTEQSMGRLRTAPKINIASYASITQALNDVPNEVIYTFLVFENDNSTVGTELALDINDYENIRVKRVHDTSELAEVSGVRNFPGLIAVRSTLETTPLTPSQPTKKNLLKAVNTFLKYKNYQFPMRDVMHEENNADDELKDKQQVLNTDIVYYSDLEKTLKTSLSTEITTHKVLSGEALQALLNYLDVLINYFPFRGNMENFIVDLQTALVSRPEWSGSDVYDTVKRLENKHSPYSSNLEYISCRGSQSKFRGYTCGLWTLFHTLTINAANKAGSGGPKVLQAMHAYIKHFFGCTECAHHFQDMSARNRLFDVKENDKAVLWLWIAHNEVNLRLAGDTTEDPEHPKIQWPSVEKCRECRLARGAWNLPPVLDYLKGVYGAENIRDRSIRARSAAAAPSPFSNLDIGMLSLLYMNG